MKISSNESANQTTNLNDSTDSTAQAASNPLSFLFEQLMQFLGFQQQAVATQAEPSELGQETANSDATTAGKQINVMELLESNEKLAQSAADTASTMVKADASTQTKPATATSDAMKQDVTVLDQKLTDVYETQAKIQAPVTKTTDKSAQSFVTTADALVKGSKADTTQNAQLMNDNIDIAKLNDNTSFNMQQDDAGDRQPADPKAKQALHINSKVAETTSAVTDSNNRTTIDIASIQSNHAAQATDNATASQAPVPHLELHQKVVDAFVNMGHLLNQETVLLPTNTRIVPNQAANTPTSLMQSAFDPLADIKMDFMPPMKDMLGAYDAKIKIYPPELGEVIARLKMGKNGAELNIETQNAQVKQLVEANLPRLLQHFQQADIKLQQVTVQTMQLDQAKQQQQHEQSSADKRAYASSDNTENQEMSNKSSNAVAEDRLVDTYA